MDRNPVLAIVAALSISLATVASADDMFDRTRHYHTAAGQEVKIGAHAHWDRRCQPTSHPNIIVTQPPLHGNVTTRPGTHVVRETVNGSNCNGREVAGIVVYYAPAAGFVGTDMLVYTVSFGANVVTSNVTIKVE